MSIIAVSNNKGGTGKTTTTVNIGAGLAARGYRVLLIDLDPQANLTQSVGVRDPEFTICHALRGEKQLGRVVLPLGNNLDIVASGKDLNRVAREVDTQPARELVLKGLLKNLRTQYDYILIDCMPALNILTHNALTAADEVYIPVQAHYLALQGLSTLVDEIELIKSTLNKRLKVGGVIITQYDNRTILNRSVLDSVNKFFDGAVFATPVRVNVSLAEAPTQGQDIFSYAPDSNGAQDYQSIVNEILNK